MGFLFFVLQHMHIYKHVLKYKYISLHSYSEQKKNNPKIKMLKYKMKANNDNILKS